MTYWPDRCIAAIKSTINSSLEDPMRCHRQRAAAHGLCTQHANARNPIYVPDGGWTDERRPRAIGSLVREGRVA